MSSSSPGRSVLVSSHNRPSWTRPTTGGSAALSHFARDSTSVPASPRRTAKDGSSSAGRGPPPLRDTDGAASTGSSGTALASSPASLRALSSTSDRGALAAQVVGATLNGVALAPAVEGRITLTGLAGHNVLRVESVQVNTTDGEGVHKVVDPADGEVYVW